MKSNKNIKNSLALIGVILIWGYVFKSKFGFFTPDLDQESVAYQEHFFQPKKYSKDTFELSLAVYDPFLGKVASNLPKYTTNQSNSSGNSNHKPSFIKTNTTTPATTSWPKIAYYGYVKNKSKGKQQACLVEINGVVNKMSLGEFVNDVKLTSIYKDSIIVQRGKEVKSIKK